MRVSVRDTDSLRKLRPLDMVAYLKSKGWTKRYDVPDREAVWGLADTAGAEYEISVPLNPHFRDFPLRVSELLDTLGDQEERSQLAIMRDIATTSADVIRIGAQSPYTADGTVPIEDAVDMVRHARDVMSAAACAALRQDTYFTGRKPAEVEEYVESLRMGQTEYGSFVVTVISRVDPLLKPASQTPLCDYPGEGLEPFPRRAVLSLCKALEATKRAAVSAALDGSITPFTEAVRDGVSANLCLALAGMMGDATGDGEVSFSVAWSPSRPLRGEVTSNISLPLETEPVLSEAAKVLMETAPREDYEVRGIVTRLDRKPDASEGQIAIWAFVDDEPRKVAVRLSEGPYHDAVRAHDGRLPVACRGVLVKDGRRFSLERPRDFRVEEDEETSD